MLTSDPSGSEDRGPVEPRLIEALQPIRSYVLAVCIYHLFETGLFDELRKVGSASVGKLVDAMEMDPAKLKALCKYLRNEGVLEEVSPGTFRLSPWAEELAAFRAWYTFFVGGYGETFSQIGEKLKRDSGWATRDASKVGIGSCGISAFDAIPLTKALFTHLPRRPRRLLDLGCGNGLYLTEFCAAFPELEEVLGVEPSEGGYKAAVALVHERGLADRVRLVCSSASAFLRSTFEWTPDVIVLNFVLHEILAQEGEDQLRSFLTELITRYPELHIVTIEVDQQIDSAEMMQHGLSRAYYNAYYLLHGFTCQRLAPLSFWEQLFAECGLEILAKQSTDPNVDSTGLEVGYLLRRKM